MLKTKPKSEDTETLIPVTVAKDRIVALRKRDRELVDQIVALENERAPANPAEPPFGEIERMAAELHRGFLPSALTGYTLGTPLFAVRRERAAIEKAIELLQEDLTAATFQRAYRELERRGDEWRSLLRERVIGICKLQHLNRLIEKTAREIRGATLISIPGDFSFAKAGGLGYAPGLTGLDECLTLMVRLGIVTPGEIEQARGDTKERF